MVTASDSWLEPALAPRSAFGACLLGTRGMGSRSVPCALVSWRLLLLPAHAPGSRRQPGRGGGSQEDGVAEGVGNEGALLGCTARAARRRRADG